MVNTQKVRLSRTFCLKKHMFVNMPLITYPDCNKKISVSAATCPNCGCYLASKRSYTSSAYYDRDQKKIIYFNNEDRIDDIDLVKTVGVKGRQIGELLLALKDWARSWRKDNTKLIVLVFIFWPVGLYGI